MNIARSLLLALVLPITACAVDPSTPTMPSDEPSDESPEVVASAAAAPELASECADKCRATAGDCIDAATAQYNLALNAPGPGGPNALQLWIVWSTDTAACTATMTGCVASCYVVKGIKLTRATLAVDTDLGGDTTFGAE